MQKAFVLTKEKKKEIEEATDFAREQLVAWGLTPRFQVDWERGKEMDGRRTYILFVYEDVRYEVKSNNHPNGSGSDGSVHY